MIVNESKRQDLYQINQYKCKVCLEYLIDPLNIIRFDIYVIPRDNHLVIQYDKLTFKINRSKDEIKEIFNYFYYLISNQFYAKRLDMILSFGINTDENYCTFSLSINNNIMYTITKNTNEEVKFHHFLNNIITPLIYLTVPVL